MKKLENLQNVNINLKDKINSNKYKSILYLCDFYTSNKKLCKYGMFFVF